MLHTDSPILRRPFFYVIEGLVLTAVVTFAVVTGNLWLPLLVIAAVVGILFAPTALPLVRQLLGTIGRLEFAWLFVFIATMCVNTLTPDQVFSGGFGRAQLLRFGFLLLALLLVLPNIIRWIRQESPGLWVGGLSKWFVAYAAFTLVSIVWSAGKLATFGKAFEMCVGLIIVLAVAAQPDAERKLKNLFVITLSFVGMLLSFILVGYVVAPGEFTNYVLMADSYTLTGGIFNMSGNLISRMGALIATVLLAYALQSGKSASLRALAFAGILFACVFPILAEGRTGIITFLLMLTLLLVSQRPLWSLPLFAGMAYVGLRYAQDFYEFFRRGQNDELFLSLSGRVGWWQAGLETFLQEPLFGYGFGVGGRVVFADIKGDVSGIHNGFLEVALGVGLVGLALWLPGFIGWLVLTLRELVRGHNTHIYCVGIPILIATVLSQGVGGWMSFELGLFFIVTVLLDKERANERRRRASAQRKLSTGSLKPLSARPAHT